MNSGVSRFHCGCGLKPFQCQPSVNSVSTSINSYEVGCLFKVSESKLCKKNGILAVSGSNLGLELTTSSKFSEAEQLLGLSYFYQSSSSN